MSDRETFDDAHDPLEHIEPEGEDIHDAADVDHAWNADEPMDDEAPTG